MSLDRRDFLKKTGLGLTAGVFGLSVFSRYLLQEAYGITPDPATQKYDAAIQIWYNGGPGQTDTFDPKPGSPNNIFNTINLGARDIYGNPMQLSELFPTLSNVVMNDPAIKLGVVRSLTHGNENHTTAETWMNCFWQSPVANLYPSTAAAMAYYFKDSALKIPSVLIRGKPAVSGCCQGEPNGDDNNTAKGGDCPTAFTVFDANQAVSLLTRPGNVDPSRYSRRRQVMDGLNAAFFADHPDSNARAYDEARRQAYDVTTSGKAASAFDLTGKTILPGGTNADPDILRQLTLAQELVKAGVPYVSCGIAGSDTHVGNKQPVTDIWGGHSEQALAKMCQNLKATGKRVLILLGGEFGRNPSDVASGRDGRDHWGSGFSWAMLSINQPSFKMTAVGDTGPDGMWTTSSATPLVDPIAPGSLGALVYRSLGFPITTDPKWNVPTIAGMKSPVETSFASSAARGNATWLMQQFGLA